MSLVTVYMFDKETEEMVGETTTAHPPRVGDMVGRMGRNRTTRRVVDMMWDWPDPASVSGRAGHGPALTVLTVPCSGMFAPETPPSSPESVPEAQTAPVGPERPCADCEHAYSTHSFPWPGSGEVCTWGQGYEGRLCGCRGFR